MELSGIWRRSDEDRNEDKIFNWLTVAMMFLVVISMVGLGLHRWKPREADRWYRSTLRATVSRRDL
jgi:hypothetical protein